MGEGGSDTAAVKIDDASAQTAGEDDAHVEGIVALRIEQAETLQAIERISLRGEMATQVPAGGVADAQFSDQCGIVQSALLQIAQRLRVAIELLLIEGGGLLEHSSRVSGRSALLLEVGEALAERQMTRQLDKAKEVAALTATMTVEEIFAGVDIERRVGFLV